MRRTVGILVWVWFFCACHSTDEKLQSVGDVNFEVISHGERVELEPHIAASGLTVFDFYADWCPPCKKLNESLKEMKGVYGDKLTVVKVDIVDWKSELAKQYSIADLPYLMVYDAQKSRVFEGPSNSVLPKLIQALNQN